VVLTDAEINAAAAVVDADRHRDPDEYAMVWLARVHATLPAGNIPPVARVMAEDLRRAGTLLVDVDHRALSRLAVAARRRRDRLHLIVHRLAEHGLIAAETPSGNVQARYRLVIPTGNSSDPRLRLPRQLSSAMSRQLAYVSAYKEYPMSPEPHPGWCTGIDCSRLGVHESESVVAGDQDALLGIAATRIRLSGNIDAVTLAFTEDDATTTYTIPAAQARALTHTIDGLLTV